MAAFSNLSNDQLADEITTWAGRVAAGEAHLLALIAELDRREAWAGPGLLSCAHWLAWRTGLSPGVAREKVRVARRLLELPAVAVAFAAGRMSWSQVRAVSRVASVDDGVDWPELAQQCSAAQLEKVVRGIRRVQQVEEAAADPPAAAQAVRTRTRYDADGRMVITIYADAQDGAVILAALDAQRAELDRQRQAQAEAEVERTAEVEAESTVDEPPGQGSSEADVETPAGAPGDGPAGTPGGAEPTAEPDADGPAGTPAAVPTREPVVGVPAGTPEELDRPAPGWEQIEGATVQAVRAAFAANEAFLRSLRSDTPTDGDNTDGDNTDGDNTDGDNTDGDADNSPDLVAAGRDRGVPAGTPTAAGGAAARPAGRDDAVSTGTGTGTGPRPATDGEALLALARVALDQQHATQPDTARRSRTRLRAQIDPLSGWGRLSDGELLPPTSLTAVLKTLPGRGGVLRLRPLTAADLTRHDQGRHSRTPSQALRELLGALDGERCRFPGCTRHRKLHAHHVFYWSAGGRTDLDDLVLVCSRHHTLIHQQNFQLVLHPDRRLTVTTADGVPVLHHPAPPWADPAALDPTGQINANTLPPTQTEPRMDLRYVVSVLVHQAA